MRTKPFSDKPIENYEGLRIIYGDDKAKGYYEPHLFSYFRDKSENSDPNNDNGESTLAEH